jgi:KipI family sensor histidine kinase inhibitor
LLDGLSDPAAWAAAVTVRRIQGVVEVVPAASSVVVRCAPGFVEAAGEVLDTVEPDTDRGDVGERVVIDVVYDGEDLPALAELAGLSPEQLVEVHTAGDYEVAFCGFSPGFGYLRGLDERLHVPRRDSPRRSVPAGAVGIAAGYTCVYPSSSPGGWHLIGHTDAAVWDVARRPPAVLRPGRRVTFRPVRR